MTLLEAKKCPCGCRQRVPIRARNHWVSDPGFPYWLWECFTEGCPAQGRLWKNQSGDEICSWCGRPRVLRRHIVGALSNGMWRLATGEIVWRTRRNSAGAMS